MITSEKVTVVERENGKKRVIIDCSGESKTQQHHEKETNVNKIMAKAYKTGMVPVSMKSPLLCENFESAADFMECQNIIAKARQDFMALPSSIRKRFANEPANLMEFLQNEDNRAEAIKLGLVSPTPVVPVVEPIVDSAELE